MTSDLAPMDVAGRAERLRVALGAAEVPALLVTDLTNIRYLTGFTGSAALLLVTDTELTFVTDGRYGQQSEAQLHAAGVQATIEVTATASGIILATYEPAGPVEHGSMIEFVHPAERALGIVRPIQEYPLFEQALFGSVH